MIDDSEFLFIPNGTDVCFSGGAKGSDQLFGSLAQKAGHKVYNFSFKGHGWDKKCGKDTIIVLTEDQLLRADDRLESAARWLMRPGLNGRTDYVKNLLRRNYWQIAITDRVYAVTSLDYTGRPNGGTGWAIAMAAQKGISEIYLYDTSMGLWFVFDEMNAFNEVEWVTKTPPRPHGRYTGIGTRNLSQEDIKAIEGLYNDTSS